MAPEDVESYVRALRERGLVFERDGEATDFVIVDQRWGPETPCPWLEFGQSEIEGNRVAACRLAGSSEQVVVTPQGWRFDRSLSASYGFVPTRAEDKSFRFLRHEGNVDVYFSELTGGEVFVGRTSGKK
jgi:hypothetical protein